MVDTDDDLKFFTVSARASFPELRDACMKIASALNWIIQKSYSMYTPGVARTVPLVALHTLRAHCALCSYTFQVWVTPHLAQGHVERVCGGFAHVINLHISLVSPMLRPSPPTPSLLFPHGQRDWSAASDIISDQPGPKIPGPALADKGEYVSGRLVKSAHLTGYEPNGSDSMINADNNATPINDPDNDGISEFSKTTHDNTGWFGVPTVFESSVPQISRGDLALQKAKRAWLGKPRASKGCGETEAVLWLVLQNRCQEGGPRSSMRSHSHQTQRKLYSDERDLREHLERRAQQAIYDENSVRRKLYSTDCNTEIQSSGRRNSEDALHESQRELESQRQQLLMANHWANKLNVKEYICAANWRWEVIFIGNATREVAKKVKNWKDDAVKRKTQQDNKSWKNVMHSKIRIHCEIRFEDYKNDSNLFRIQEFSKILTHRAFMAVLTFLIKLVLPRVPESQAAIQERRELHELIWVLLEMFMIANLHDVILTTYVTIRRIWQNHREVLRREGIEKRGSAEPLQSIPLPCCQEKASTYGLDWRGCLTSMTNHAAGIGTST